MNATPAGSPTSDRAVICYAVDLAQRFTDRLLEDFPHGQARHRPASTDNHAQWIVGHMAVGYDDVATLLDDRASDLDAAHRRYYGWQSKPHDHAAGDEPAFSALLGRLERSRDRLRVAVNGAAVGRLDGAPPEELAYLAPSLGMLALSCAWHEGWHAGQLASIRRHLGLPAAVSQVEQP